MSSYHKILFFLGLAGVLFSGYLSFFKLFTTTCAFNEPCPYFLGYPTCFYGFGMFLAIFIATLFSIFHKISFQKMLRVHIGVSFLGIVFALYFTIPEIYQIFLGGKSTYLLGLPTCAYGLIFYIIIFILSLKKKGSL